MIDPAADSFDSAKKKGLSTAILERTKDVNCLVVDERDVSFDGLQRDISFDGLSLYQSSSDEEELLDIPAASASASSKRKYCLEPVAPAFGAASEATTYEGKEQISPRKKKLKTFVNDAVGEKDECRGHQTCIEQCRIFLPDCEFDKDKLVQMWIAEGLFELEVTKRMEDVASSYFDALVEEEVLVPSNIDDLYGSIKYKVNASKASTWSIKGSDNCEGVLHLTCRMLDRVFFYDLKKFQKLRTLILIEDCSSYMKQLPDNMFLGLKLLRTLDLSGNHISELPGSIGKLESLRFLDVSETRIKRLPESVERLSMLQTLKLKKCFALLALPEGLARLQNLRHLDLHILSQLKSMPKGMGKLIKLQTLQAFLVRKINGCGIGELKNLNEITGSFCVSNLENVSSAEEAKEAALCDKERIEQLELRWCDPENEDSQDTAEILENLQPHFQLRKLQLTFYRGSKLPTWISNPSFTALASITLYKCINCDILPSLGVLPSLKVLLIVGMDKVKSIDTVFSRKHETQGYSAFPMLEKLTIDHMLNLEEWTGIKDGDFPCLRNVSIGYCPKLRVLPSLSPLYSLQHLEICSCMQLISLPEGLPSSLDSLIVTGCPKINGRCMKDGGDWLKIASVKDIWIDYAKLSRA